MPGAKFALPTIVSGYYSHYAGCGNWSLCVRFHLLLSPGIELTVHQSNVSYSKRITHMDGIYQETPLKTYICDSI